MDQQRQSSFILFSYWVFYKITSELFTLGTASLPLLFEAITHNGVKLSAQRELKILTLPFPWALLCACQPSSKSGGIWALGQRVERKVKYFKALFLDINFVLCLSSTENVFILSYSNICNCFVRLSSFFLMRLLRQEVW